MKYQQEENANIGKMSGLCKRVFVAALCYSIKIYVYKLRY